MFSVSDVTSSWNIGKTLLWNHQWYYVGLYGEYLETWSRDKVYNVGLLKSSSISGWIVVRLWYLFLASCKFMILFRSRKSLTSRYIVYWTDLSAANRSNQSLKMVRVHISHYLFTSRLTRPCLKMCENKAYVRVNDVEWRDMTPSAPVEPSPVVCLVWLLE